MSLPRDRSPLPSLPRLAAVLAAALAGACGGGAGDKAANMGGYLGGLPSWTDYAPALEEQPPEQTGPPSAATAEAADVTIYNDNGTTSVKTNVAFTCTTTPYSFTKTPDQLVSYSPSAGALWAGALVQGKTYRTGNGPLLSLPVAERGPLRIVIKTLANAENSRTIDRPSQASVESARGAMIQNATLQNLSTPSTISYQLDSYHSESEYALSMGLSGRYMGFEASASGSAARTAAETTIAVTFIQKMYEVTVDPTSVPTPASFFGPDFTQARLDEQTALGNIGPANPPVFVAGIVYGRMMTFTFTSSASESDMKATIETAYNGIGGGGAADLSAKQKKILQQAKIRIASLGGDAQATLDMIRSGNWADYFTSNPPITSAEPLSYTLWTLSNQPATVTEATSFDVKTCLPQSTASGGVSFPAVQAFATAPVGSPYEAAAGDFDGDGLSDLVFDHLGLTNDVSVAFGQWSGVFEAPTPAVSHPLTGLADGWANYTLHVADVDGDGKDDLVWNFIGTSNIVYVGISKGDGTFTFSSAPALNQAGGWTVYGLKFGRLRLPPVAGGRQAMDFVWHSVPFTANRTYTGIYDPSTGAIALTKFDAPSTGWTPYVTGVGDIDGDELDDVYWIRRNTPFVHTAFSDGAGGLAFGPGWSTVYDYTGYTPAVADGDGDGRDDVVMIHTSWPRSSGTTKDQVILRLWQSDGDGTFTVKPYCSIPSGYGTTWVPTVADLTGDGAADVILNELTATSNTVTIAASTKQSAAAWNTVGAVKQVHPAGNQEDWSSFRMFVGQFGGDLQRDLVWVKTGASVRIAVGLKI